MTIRTAPDPRFAGLSCYTSNLVSYLATEFATTPRDFADSVRFAVRIDLDGGDLAFSHHREPLNRLPDGTWLGYACGTPEAAVAGLDAELGRHGRVLVATDAAALDWAPAARTGRSAPHWVLVDGRRTGEWHVVDAFEGLLDGGEQVPYAGWLPADRLLDAMTPRAPWTRHQRLRNELAFGFANPVPAGPHWLSRRSAPPPDPRRLPGDWLFDGDALTGLAELIAADPEVGERHLPDLWAAAQHHLFRHRTRGDAGAESAWAALPQAVRFAVDSARRGRPRTSLLFTTFANLAKEVP